MVFSVKIEKTCYEGGASMKCIGLIAHDECKSDLLKWVGKHLTALEPHHLFATGTTGGLLTETYPNLLVSRFRSGPLGGDQQMGSAIAEKTIDLLIFFIDPLGTHPHDVDIKALLRLAVLYDVPSAFNEATADFLVSSPHFQGPYEPHERDHGKYLARFAAKNRTSQ